MHHSLDGIDLGGIISTPNFFLILIFYSKSISKEGSSHQGPQGPRQEGRLQESHQEGRSQEGRQKARRQEGKEGPRRQEALIRFLD